MRTAIFFGGIGHPHEFAKMLLARIIACHEFYSAHIPLTWRLFIPEVGDTDCAPCPASAFCPNASGLIIVVYDLGESFAIQICKDFEGTSPFA